MNKHQLTKEGYEIILSKLNKLKDEVLKKVNVDDWFNVFHKL